jgi:ABC-type glycerol-3-phosphate transport system permease component
MAGSLLATLPPLLLFFVAQRQLIGGISVEGLKG